MEKCVPRRGIANFADELTVLRLGVDGQVRTCPSPPQGVAQGAFGDRDDERSQRRRLPKAMDGAEQVEKDVLFDVLAFGRGA